MPERVLPLQGASNFRDLGGYATQDGRRVRWRLLFRSDHLGRLTSADQQALRALGVRRALDFRGQHERADAPYSHQGLVQHALSIEPSVAQQMQALAQAGLPLTPERMAQLMTDLYERLVDEHAARYAEFFGLLLDDTQTGPLVFHCTAGKDRTGIAAALLLLALGVPRAQVEQDFLLSNHHFRRPASTATHGIPEASLAVLWSVRAEYLAHALQTIERRHGGLAAYLEHRLGLGERQRQQLAGRYLEAG